MKWVGRVVKLYAYFHTENEYKQLVLSEPVTSNKQEPLNRFQF